MGVIFWAWIKANPLLALEWVASVAGVAVVSLFLLRYSYLNNENVRLEEKLAVQQKTISEIQKLALDRDRVAVEDAARARVNSDNKTKTLVEIERMKNDKDCPAAPVLRSTYDRMFTPISSGN